MKNILVAVDGSASSERAAAFAATLAKGLSAGLTLITAYELSLSRDLENLRIVEHATIGDVIEADAKATLERASRAALDQGVSPVRMEPVLGPAPEAILNYAELVKPDLIVIGKRGRSQLAGLVLGSVSQKLVALAKCPVAAVP